MSRIRTHARLLVVAVCCVVLGAVASAVAGAGAATGAKPSHHTRAARGALRRLIRRTVHGDLVVHAKSGFVTVTVDRGTVRSISGNTMTLAEGTPKATYKTVTVTIPAGAVVRDDGHRATLASVHAGQRVVVVKAPQRTAVIARAPRTHP